MPHVCVVPYIFIFLCIVLVTFQDYSGPNPYDYHSEICIQGVVSPDILLFVCISMHIQTVIPFYTTNKGFQSCYLYIFSIFLSLLLLYLLIEKFCLCSSPFSLSRSLFKVKGVQNRGDKRGCNLFTSRPTPFPFLLPSILTVPQALVLFSGAPSTPPVIITQTGRIAGRLNEEYSRQAGRRRHHYKVHTK